MNKEYKDVSVSKDASVSFGMVKGRHEMPVTDYIFDIDIEDVFDFKWMQETIHFKLKNVDSLNLYVSGLTVVLVEIINYCIFNNISLTLYHFDRESNGWVAQKTDTSFWAPYLEEGGYI